MMKEASEREAVSMNNMGKWLMSSISVKVDEAIKNFGITKLTDRVNKLELNSKRLDTALSDGNDSIDCVAVSQNSQSRFKVR